MSAKQARPTKKLRTRERADHLELIDDAERRLDAIRSGLVLLVAAAGSADPALFDLSESDVRGSLCEAAQRVLADVVALGDVHEGLHDAVRAAGDAR